MHDRSITLVSAALLVAAAYACREPAPKREWTPADHGQPEQVAPDRVPGQEDSAEAAGPGEDPSVRAARALWIATCSGCHGRDGRGQGQARPPGAQLPDFSTASWQRSRTDLQLTQAIRDGRSMMPAFGKRVNDEGIAVLVQHIRTLAAAPVDEQSPAAEAPSAPADHPR